MNPESAFLFELDDVGKGYGPPGPGRAEILHEITLQIREGEFIAIVGYSGSGKTTLISLMAGLTAPDTGRVLHRGAAVTGPSPDRALVFQNYSLLPWLNVEENVGLAVDAVFGEWSREKRQQHVEKFIGKVHLTEARHKRPRELSGGMRQRVAVARALAMEPKLLLLDEPLAALDALTRANLQDEIARLWEMDKKTVVLITNDVDEGILLADRIIPLSAGPRATLGPEIRIDLPRPRDRKAINHDPRYKEIRKQVIDFLLGPGGKPHVTVTKNLFLPDIEPEDLTRAAHFGLRRQPRRRREMVKETIEVH